MLKITMNAVNRADGSINVWKKFYARDRQKAEQIVKSTLKAVHGAQSVSIIPNTDGKPHYLLHLYLTQPTTFVDQMDLEIQVK